MKFSINTSDLKSVITCLAPGILKTGIERQALRVVLHNDSVEFTAVVGAKNTQEWVMASATTPAVVTSRDLSVFIIGYAALCRVVDELEKKGVCMALFSGSEVINVNDVILVTGAPLGGTLRLPVYNLTSPGFFSEPATLKIFERFNDNNTLATEYFSVPVNSLYESIMRVIYPCRGMAEDVENSQKMFYFSLSEKGKLVLSASDTGRSAALELQNVAVSENYRGRIYNNEDGKYDGSYSVIENRFIPDNFSIIGDVLKSIIPLFSKGSEDVVFTDNLDFLKISSYNGNIKYKILMYVEHSVTRKNLFNVDIPRTTIISMVKQDFINAMSNLYDSAQSGDTDITLSATQKGGNLIIQNKSATISVPCLCSGLTTGVNLEITINFGLLLDALEWTYDADIITIGIGAATGPLSIFTGDYRQVIVPLAVKRENPTYAGKYTNYNNGAYDY
jgi:hypothetical protein